MKANTRFVPTVNGPLHLGHVYNILVNQAEARRSGGKFTIRLDDTQRYWTWLLGEQGIDGYIDLMHEDLEWLGIRPERWSAQSQLMARAEDLVVHQFGSRWPEQTFTPLIGCEAAGSPVNYYPYAERLSIEHVVMDLLEEINLVIRGEDLLTEDALYAHLCTQYGIIVPRRVYIPRLRFEGDEVSKTRGHFAIADFRRAGYDPEELLARLGDDCLNGPHWTLEHLKPAPSLGKWAEEALHGIPTA